MQQADGSFNITHEYLVRYVFRQLSPEEEAQIEDFLDANPHEADIVEGILDFCKEKGIRSREAFDEAWGNEMVGVQARRAQQESPLAKGHHSTIRRKWLGRGLMLAIIIVCIGLGNHIFFNDPPQPAISSNDTLKTIPIDPTIVSKDTILLSKPTETTLTATKCQLSEDERRAWLQDFINEVRGYHTSAGGADSLRNWQDYLSSQTPECEKAFQNLLKMAKTTPESMQPRDHYGLGVLQLLYKRNADEAIRFLEEAQGISRPHYNKIRLAAYLEQGAIRKAKDWVKAQNIPVDELPQWAIPCLK